jgi:internalin A
LVNVGLVDIDFLQHFTALEELQLSNNGINDVSPLANLRSLKSLDLSWNHITNINELQKLTSLQILFLNSNQLEDINFVAKLPELKELYVANNYIATLEALENLKKLEYLNISNNHIEDLSPLRGLPLEALFVNNNPCTKDENLNPSQNHVDFLHLWLAKNNLEDKITVLLPKKIVFLGNHASGKSSLLYYLQHGKFAPETCTTHVLNVLQHELNTEEAQIVSNFYDTSEIKEILPLMCYDFGGQDFYHGLYQSFSTKTAFQIIVYCAEQKHIEVVKDTNGYDTYKFPLTFWLQEKEYLEVTSKNSYFIVENKIDAKVINAFSKNYPTISDFHAPVGLFHVYLKELQTKNTTEAQRNQLQLQFLKTQLLQELYEPQEISERIVAFYKEVYNDSILEELEIRSFDYYKSKVKGLTHKNMLTQLQLLENSGVLFLSEDQTEVIVNPKAFITYIHEEILKHDIIFEKNGRLTVEEWEKVNTGEHSKRVEAFMLKQKTLFYDKDAKAYVFPNYLLLYSLDKERYFLNVAPDKLLFSIQFQYFIPFGFINVLIHHFGKEPNRKKFWRDAIYFIQHEDEKPKANVFIVINIPKLTIEVSLDVTASDFDATTYKRYLWTSLSRMYHQQPLISWEVFKKNIIQSNGFQEGIRKLYETYGTFPETTKVAVEDSFFMSLKELDNYIKSQEYTVQIENEQGRSKQFPLQSFQLFTEKPIKKMKKIFISYSNKDIYYKQELEKFLMPLEKFQVAQSWSGEEVTDGLWHEQIQDEIQSSDIVILMMSMNFASSDYILNEEVFKALKQMAKNPEKQLVCILVKQFPWSFFSKLQPVFNINDKDLSDADKAAYVLANLPKQQFLPFYTDTRSLDKNDHKRYLKPINQWEFPEEAFTQIVEALGKIL